MSDKNFEITHDSLAAKIWEKISAEEKGLIEVRNFITAQYKSYTSRIDLLSEKDIQYISPYLDKLLLNEEEDKFIQKSISFRRRQKIYLIGGIALAFFVISLALVQNIQSRKVADSERQKAVAALAERDHLAVEEKFRKAEAYLAASEDVDSVFNEIRKMDTTAGIEERIKSLKEKYNLK